MSFATAMANSLRSRDGVLKLVADVEAALKDIKAACSDWEQTGVGPIWLHFDGAVLALENIETLASRLPAVIKKHAKDKLAPLESLYERGAVAKDDDVDWPLLKVVDPDKATRDRQKAMLKGAVAKRAKKEEGRGQ